ncbi:MAG: M48 family metalloprotease [Phycisphaerales bacterium]
MAMDFFEHQQAARKRTGLLVALFTLAIACIVAITCAVVALILATVGAAESTSDDSLAQRAIAVDWRILAGTAGAVVGIVFVASAVKLAELRAGGGAIAERLGGRLVTHDADDPSARRALNVVEEMAIASGVPTPPVYILDDERVINAFAAGYAPSDAVVGLTRGCVERLSRDELQGVVAHEFSHILNGDMRRNIRLIGLLHGVLALGLVGAVLLRSMRYGLYAGGRRRSSSRSGDGGAAIVIAILAIGLTLYILGSVGSFFGGLIKSAVSRQREFLADASAVQFTRNPAGIAGALKRIGGMSRHGRLTTPNAQLASHMYFAEGVGFHLTSLFATHPPLDKRIRRIEPDWDGRYPAPDRARADEEQPPSAQPTPVRAAGANLAALHESIAHVGQPTRDHLDAAAQLLHAAPAALLRAAHDAFGAQALVAAALLDAVDAVRREQVAILEQHAPRGVAAAAQRLAPETASLDPALRLPLLDIALGSLRSLADADRQRLRAVTERLIAADQKIGLFEWCLRRLLVRALRDPERPRITHYGMQRLAAPVSQTLAALAAIGGRDDGAAQTAFDAAAATLPDVRTRFIPPADTSLRALDEALSALAGLAPRHKRRLLDACAVCVAADGEAQAPEVETLRAIADALGCPMPPVLLGA